MKFTKIATVAFLSLLATHSSADPAVYLAYQDAGDIDAGYGIGVKYEFLLAEQLSADIRLSYFTGFKNELGYYSRQSEDVAMIPLEVNINWSIPVNEYTPYFGAGAGYYYIGSDFIDSEVGLNVHGGVTCDIGNGISLFAEIKYTQIASDYDLDGIGVSAGVAWEM